MAIGQNLFKVRRRHPGQAISGIANFLAPEGLLVNYDPASQPNLNPGTPNLKPATGIRAFSLLRAIVTSIPLDNFVFPQSVIKNQDTIGSAVTASRILEAEFEGPDLVLYSGTGLVNGATAVGTKVSTKNGALYVAQGSDEEVGRIRAQLTPLDVNNPSRILVEFVE